MTLEERYTPLIQAILKLLDGANLTEEPYRTNTAIRLILLFDEYALKQLLDREEE